MEQDKQQGGGPSCLSLLPLLFPFHQGNTKANQELREAEGARGIESTEKQMEGFEGPWWHQNPYGSTRGITIKEQKPLGTREGHQTQMNSICERPGGVFSAWICPLPSVCWHPGFRWISRCVSVPGEFAACGRAALPFPPASHNALSVTKHSQILSFIKWPILLTA